MWWACVSSFAPPGISTLLTNVNKLTGSRSALCDKNC